VFVVSIQVEYPIILDWSSEEILQPSLIPSSDCRYDSTPHNSNACHNRPVITERDDQLSGCSETRPEASWHSRNIRRNNDRFATSKRGAGSWAFPDPVNEFDREPGHSDALMKAAGIISVFEYNDKAFTSVNVVIDIEHTCLRKITVRPELIHDNFHDFILTASLQNSFSHNVSSTEPLLNFMS
jgi:hypothetical protein